MTPWKAIGVNNRKVSGQLHDSAALLPQTESGHHWLGDRMCLRASLDAVWVEKERQAFLRSEYIWQRNFKYFGKSALSRDSVVGIGFSLRTGWSCFDSRQGQVIFLFSKTVFHKGVYETTSCNPLFLIEVTKMCPFLNYCYSHIHLQHLWVLSSIW
jgi:hypothetical protein